MILVVLAAVLEVSRLELILVSLVHPYRLPRVYMCRNSMGCAERSYDGVNNDICERLRELLPCVVVGVVDLQLYDWWGIDRFAI